MAFRLLLVLAATSAQATDSLHINNAWIAEAPPVSTVQAGYFNLHNTTGKTIALTSVSSDAYDNIEMHLSVEKNGVASMQRVSKIEVAPGDRIQFAPGGYHLMLYKPVCSFKQGDKIMLHFTLSDATTITITAVVKKYRSSFNPHL